MPKPILHFSERKTPYGIELIGTVSLKYATTLPIYNSEAINHRGLAEGFIIASITDQWVRLRGLHKLELARKNLADNGFVKDGSILNAIDELIHELKQPQFIIKGEKQ